MIEKVRVMTPPVFYILLAISVQLGAISKKLAVIWVEPPGRWACYVWALGENNSVSLTRTKKIMTLLAL